MEKIKIAIADVKVGERCRKKMKNIDALAASMNDRGLLQPIAVWPDYTLACGERRLKAAMQLGWEKIDAVVLGELESDLLEHLLVERDENTCRENFEPTEAVKLGKKIKAAEKDAAKRRQREGQKRGAEKTNEILGHKTSETVSPNFGETVSPEPSQCKHQGEAKRRVAAAVGMSGVTFEKAEAVVDAAESEPALYGDLPAKMDIKSVDAAYKELQKRKHPEPPEPEPLHPHSDLLCQWLDFVSGTTHVIEIEKHGLPAMLEETDAWDWPRVQNYILPRIRDLNERLSSYMQELESHAAQH